MDATLLTQDKVRSTILVVDDEQAIVHIVTGVLNDSGLTVLGTTDPHEAVRLMKENHSIKLILSDVVMPEVSGPEIIRRAMKTREDEVRVVFMSGGTDGTPFRRTDHFLEKPLRFEALATELRRALITPPIPLAWDGPERRRLRKRSHLHE